MAGTYTYGSSSSTPAKQTPAGSGKNRIYQSFKHSIELDELSLAASDKRTTQKIASSASLQYPLIKINDYIVSDVEIEYLEIDSTGFLPTITLKCLFIHQQFLSKEMPKDGDIISIAIRNKSDTLKIIRNDYVITGLVSSNKISDVSNPMLITFFGQLYVPLLNSTLSGFSFEGTSFETLKQVAKLMNLGFASNEENTDDKQIWLSSYNNMAHFINITTQRAYKDDKSFFKSWIDIYYNLNFVNVNNLLLSSENEVDPAAWINNIDNEYTYGEDTTQSDTVETVKVLSNYDKYKTSSFFITKWRPNNKSTKITFETGTTINCNMFEHNNKLFNNSNAQKFWSVPIEPTYDPNKTDKYILLRGRARQNPELKGNDLAKANYVYPELYNQYAWMGIQYTISNPDDPVDQWDGNHHKNYERAKVQNYINNKELDKLNLEVNVNGLNTNIIKGDKTPIVLISADVVENNITNIESGGLDYLEQFYSGWYYVKGFKIIYSTENKESILSNFRQQFILTRREWPPPIAVGGLNENNNE